MDHLIFHGLSINMTKETAEIIFKWLQGYLNENPITQEDMDALTSIAHFMPDRIDEIKEIWLMFEADN